MADLHRVDVGIAVSTAGLRFLVAVDDDGHILGIPLVSLAADCPPWEAARRLLMDVTGLVDGEWVVLRLIGVFVEDSAIRTLYGAELPEDVPVSPGYAWMGWPQVSAIPKLINQFLMACRAIRV